MNPRRELAQFLQAIGPEGIQDLIRNSHPGRVHPMSELDAEHQHNWRRLTELQDTIATAQAEEKHVKELLRKGLAAGTYTVDGDPVLKLSASRRFNADEAVKALDPKAATECFVWTIDPKRVRAKFSEEAAEAFMVETTTRIGLL